MGDFSLMASAAFTPVGIFHQDQVIRTPKDLQSLLPGPGKRQDKLTSRGVQIAKPQSEDPWDVTTLLSDTSNQLYMGDSRIKDHVLIDVQDAHLESVLFSYGVAEQCNRHEKISEFLTSGSSLADENKDISLISDLMGFQTISSSISPEPHFPVDAKNLLYDVGMDEFEQFLPLQSQLYASKPLLEFVRNLSHSSTITVHRNGQVLFSGNENEIRDFLSIVEEFNHSKLFSSGNMKAMVVPYFTRKRGGHARTNTRESFLKLETLTNAPLKSSSTSKSSSPPRKKLKKKSIKEKEMYSKNYFHACESLLNVYLDKKGDKTVILSLKNSSPELSHVLHQFSAGIAGTGLAVLLSVACKSVNGRALSLSSGKLLNVSFGFGLFWLSWGVNRLQDTVRNASKKSNRGKIVNEEVITKEVERSVNDVIFRALALAAVAIIRLG